MHTGIMPKPTRYFLKLEDLENGEFYRCRLSNLVVLVNITFLDNGAVNVCNFKYYNESLSAYGFDFPSDYQLEKI